MTGRDAPDNYRVKTISVLSTQFAHPGTWEVFLALGVCIQKRGWWKRGKRLVHFNLAHAEYLPRNCQQLSLPPLSFCGHQMLHHLLPVEFLSEFSRFLLGILKPNAINTYLTGGGSLLTSAAFDEPPSAKQKLFCFDHQRERLPKGEDREQFLKKSNKTQESLFKG